MTDVLGRLSASLAGRYAIERELGQGGMATVYLAHDVRHDRPVAVKVLRPDLVAVIGAERFLSEIKTTANLQHPHILPLHDSGEADGFLFYVMPYVEGESLRDRLTREKQLPVAEAVRITSEVADALDYAHRHKVIHRDIKPENILLHDGRALVADFGIALAVSSAGGTRMTETGMSLGTPAYMAPEQAMGEKEITPKADVYALGCVLYEMLAGEPPFTGPTAQAIVARVVTEEPRSLTLQRRTVPRHVEAAVRMALAKLPADRFASAAEFKEALARPELLASSGLAASPGESAAAPVVAAAPRWTWPAAAPWAVALLAAGAAVWGWLRPQPEPVPPPVVRFALSFGRSAQLRDAPGSPIAVSPDGSRIVYVGTDSAGISWLFSRGLERNDPVLIAGTRQAQQPFFSPDSRFLGFFQDGRLRKVSLAGGAVVSVCDVPGGLGGAAWGVGDVIVFASQGRLFSVNAAGGRADTLATPDSGRGELYRWPDLLPDGRSVLLTVVAGGEPSLAAMTMGDTAIRRLEQSGMSPRWVDGGYIVFSQTDNTLFTAPFDAGALRLMGPPQPVAENVRLGPGMVAKLGVARTGALAYLSGQRLAQRELVTVDRDGRAQLLAAPQALYNQPRFSPDGQRIAVEIGLPGSPLTGDVWVFDRRAGNLARLTFDSASIRPEWTPDGRFLVYSTRRGGRSVGALYRVPADGSGAPESLLVRPNQIWESQLTRDGRTLVFRETHPQTNRDVLVTRTDSPSAARPLLATSFEERGIALSADGGWLAYVSNETGSDEVYVRRLSRESARWRVSTSGGWEPRWNRNGRELLFRRGDSVYAVAVEPSAGFRAGTPRALFGARGFQSNPQQPAWDVSPDGRQFVFVREQSSGQGAEELQVLLHWFDQLRAGRVEGARGAER
jgi:serine/threonine-protein kinase